MKDLILREENYTRERFFLPLGNQGRERNTRQTLWMHLAEREANERASKWMQIYADSFYQPVLYFFLNLWSFKIAGGQTAGCLKFMKHLFNSPGRDLSWQPFTFTTPALLARRSSGPHWTWCMLRDTLLSCITHVTLLRLLWSGG